MEPALRFGLSFKRTGSRDARLFSLPLKPPTDHKIPTKKSSEGAKERALIMNGHRGQNIESAPAVRGVRISVPEVHEGRPPGVKRSASAVMTKDGSSRFGSDSSKRRKSGDLNDRFDGMIRRTQRFRSGTGSSRNPASSSSKRKSAKKRPAPDPGCLRSKGIQDIRGDCVGREFAVLKRQGQEVLQTDDPDETGPDQAEQARNRKNLPAWLLNTFALLPRTHPLQKLTPVQSGSPNECGEPMSSTIPANGNPFAPVTRSPAEFDGEIPFRSTSALTPTRPLLSGHSAHASQSQSYHCASTQARLDGSLQELSPTAWPFYSPRARGATTYPHPSVTRSHGAITDEDMSAALLSPFVPKKALAVDFQSIDHSPVVSDMTTRTSLAQSEVPKHYMKDSNSPHPSRFGMEEWPGMSETWDAVSPSPPRSTWMASPAGGIFHPSPRRYNAPGVLELDVGLFNKPEQGLSPIAPENNAVKDFDRERSDDEHRTDNLLVLGVEGRDPATLPKTFGLNLRYTDPTIIAGAFASPSRGRNSPGGHLTSPLSPTFAPACDSIVTTPQQPQLTFVPFQTPHFYLQQARSTNTSPTQGRTICPRTHQKTDRYAEDLVAYAAKMDDAEMPLSSARILLFDSNDFQQDRTSSLQYDSSGGSTAGNSPPDFRWTEPVHVGEVAMHPSSEPSEETLDSTSPWSSRLMEVPPLNVRASGGYGQTGEVDGGEIRRDTVLKWDAARSYLEPEEQSRERSRMPVHND